MCLSFILPYKTCIVAVSWQKESLKIKSIRKFTHLFSPFPRFLLSSKGQVILVSVFSLQIYRLADWARKKLYSGEDRAPLQAAIFVFSLGFSWKGCYICLIVHRRENKVGREGIPHTCPPVKAVCRKLFLDRLSRCTDHKGIKQQLILCAGMCSPWIAHTQPCIRLAHLKFELTNEDAAGGKQFQCPDVNVS